MLSNREYEFLRLVADGKNPRHEGISYDYQRVLITRINSKIILAREHLQLVEEAKKKGGFGMYNLY